MSGTVKTDRFRYRFHLKIKVPCSFDLQTASSSCIATLGTMPALDILPLFSAGRSRKLTLVPIIQSLAQMEKKFETK